MTVTCPYCGVVMPWTPQPKRVEVWCPNREMTQWQRTEPHRIAQKGFAIYKSATKCWIETYLMDGPDRAPSWYCHKTFAVI